MLTRIPGADLDAILHLETFQRAESAWRGARFLTDHLVAELKAGGPAPEVTVEILSVPRNELAARFRESVFEPALGAQADTTGELGTMSCSRIAGTGYNLLITSSADVRCTFSGSGGSEQWYMGSTGVSVGADLSWKTEETISFAVVSATQTFAPEGDFLTGGFAGAKAHGAIGKGAGISVLVRR